MQYIVYTVCTQWKGICTIRPHSVLPCFALRRHIVWITHIYRLLCLIWSQFPKHSEMRPLGFMSYLSKSTHPARKSTLTCLTSATVVCLSSTHIWFLPKCKQTNPNSPFLISYVKLFQCSSIASTAVMPLPHPLWPKNAAWGLWIGKAWWPLFSVLARAFSWWRAFVCLLWMTLHKQKWLRGVNSLFLGCCQCLPLPFPFDWGG